MAEEEEDLEGAAEEGNEEEVSMKEGRGGGERMEGKWKGEEGQRGEEREASWRKRTGGGPWGEREEEGGGEANSCFCVQVYDDLPLTKELAGEGLSLLCKTGNGLAHAYVRMDLRNK